MNSCLFQLEERIRNSSHSCGTDNNIHLSFCLRAVLTFLPSVIIYSEEIWTAWKSHRTSHQYIILMASCWLFRISKKEVASVLKGFPGGSDSNESTCEAGDLGSIPGLGRSPGEKNGYTRQYSCLENSHGQRSLVGHSSGGCRVGHDWACKHSSVLKALVRCRVPEDWRQKSSEDSGIWTFSEVFRGITVRSMTRYSTPK